MKKSDHIFLCHAKEDKADVQKLFQRLKSEGLNPWLDEEYLHPGQDWAVEIQKAIRTARLFLACLSPHAVSKTGFINRELRQGLKMWQEHPEGSIYMIPVLLEPCSVPEGLRHLQWADLSKNGGIEQLLDTISEVIGRRPYGSLGKRADALYNWHLVRVRVVDSKTSQHIASARVVLNEVVVQDPLKIQIINLKLRSGIVPENGLAAETDSAGLVFFALPYDMPIIIDGLKYVLSATTNGFSICHCELKDYPVLKMLKAFTKDTSIVFGAEEVGDIVPRESIEMKLHSL